MAWNTKLLSCPPCRRTARMRVEAGRAVPDAFVVIDRPARTEIVLRLEGHVLEVHALSSDDVLLHRHARGPPCGVRRPSRCRAIESSRELREEQAWPPRSSRRDRSICHSARRTTTHWFTASRRSRTVWAEWTRAAHAHDRAKEELEATSCGEFRGFLIHERPRTLLERWAWCNYACSVRNYPSICGVKMRTVVMAHGRIRTASSLSYRRRRRCHLRNHDESQWRRLSLTQAFGVVVARGRSCPRWP